MPPLSSVSSSSLSSVFETIDLYSTVYNALTYMIQRMDMMTMTMTAMTPAYFCHH